MSDYVPLASLAHEFIKSPHFELLTSRKPFSLSANLLANFKEWPGTLPTWMDLGSGLAGIFRSVDERRKFRRRYSAATIQLAAGNPAWPGYVGNWALQGPGFLPRSSGFPTADGSLAPGYFESLGAPVIGGADYGVIFPGLLNSSNGNFTSASAKGFLLRAPDGLPLDTISITLSAESKFSDALTPARTRVNQRAWPAFQEGFNSFQEIFGEWELSGTLDGGWHAFPQVLPRTVGNPYFGANPKIPFSNLLWSGWTWVTTEEGGALVDTPYAAVIQCQRCRFRCNSAVPYFVVEALVNRCSGVGPLPDGPDSLNIIAAGQDGITTPNQIVEIPFPGQTDFVESQLTLAGQPTLSCGAINFAIVGETIDQWFARTGV